MNLNKLLAVGRSFVGGKDTPGRFKMTTQNLLPHFGSGRRQMVVGPASACVSGSSSAPGVEAGVGEVRSGSGGLGEPEAKESVASGRLMLGLGQASAVSVGRAVHSGRARIDAVRVVRNDLSDSDLEVVSVRREPVVVVSAEPRASEVVESGGVWRQVVARVFRDTRVGV